MFLEGVLIVFISVFVQLGFLVLMQFFFSWVPDMSSSFQHAVNFLAIILASLGILFGVMIMLLGLARMLTALTC